jgi:hypothetical protein
MKAADSVGHDWSENIGQERHYEESQEN